MSGKPDITIIVCTYNRAESLRVALKSLSALQLGGYTAEILVVNNNSTDDTDRIVQYIASESPIKVRSVLETEQGIVPARNCGVTQARGDWIAFFDDDQLAEPDWIIRLLEVAERRDVKSVGGAVRLRMPEPGKSLRSPIIRMLLGETVGMNTECQYNRRVTPGCGNWMIHRDVFQRVGLFDPTWAKRGEDTDLWQRMVDASIVGWFTPKAVVHHVILPERLTTAYLLKLSSVMVEGMAEDEHYVWGRWYLAIWLARVCQAVFVLGPRWLWAMLTFDQELRLGARCRLSIASQYLRNGLGLLWPGRSAYGSARARKVIKC